MADLVQDTRLQFKRASAEYWETNNPVLLQGEPGYVNDLKDYKIGDGSTAWNDLPYTNDNAYNFIINGGFDVWQRGTTFTSSSILTGEFSADRWRIEWTPSIACNFVVSRQELEPESIHDATDIVAETGYEGKYFFRYDLNTGGIGDNNKLMRQPIEDVRTFSNQYVTFSFYARADIDSNTTDSISNRELQFSLQQHFTSTDSVETHRANASLTSEWQRFSETFFIPSIEGKTIDQVSYINATIFFPYQNYDNTTGFVIDVWGVQVEPSNVIGKSFRRNSPNIALEVASCQRYYSASRTIGSSGSVSNGYINYQAVAATTNANWHTVFLPQYMRSTPTVSVYYSATSGVVYDYGLASNTAAATTDVTSQSFTVYISGSSSGGGNRIRFGWEADAELDRV